jgi:[ribosomal protein S5]-alanine N-acetyltransferase
VSGPRLTLRFPAPADAPRLFALASDPLVTRWFSWGPYAEVGQAEAWIAAQAAKRDAGEIMDFVVVDPDDGVLGVTGLT